MIHTFQSAADVARFALAGRAVVTVQNAVTGQHYTFRIAGPGKNSNADHALRFVFLRTGEGYTYLGMIPNADEPRFRLTAKSKLKPDSGPVKAATFFCSRVLAHPEAPLPSGLIVRHEGRCGMCGRPLTHPESLDIGLGPECAARWAPKE